MLKVKDLSFRYSRRGRNVIDGLSLSLPEGGIYGLLGSNGAGKSTLLYLISGMLTPLAGCVTLDGTDTRLRRPATVSDLMLLPEEFELPAMSLEEYIRVNAPFYPRFSRQDMERNLSRFDLDPGLRLNALSMGQKKKAALSFALACHTRVLLLDEPTNGLDIPAKGAFRRCVAENVTDDTLCLISTHQVRDIGQILDHLLIMERSCILLDQPMAEVERRLAFVDTSDAAIAARALYSQKGFGGVSAILPNDGSVQTEVNLEMLFQFATEHPDMIQNIFNQK